MGAYSIIFIHTVQSRMYAYHCIVATYERFIWMSLSMVLAAMAYKEIIYSSYVRTRICSYMLDVHCNIFVCIAFQDFENLTVVRY